VSGRVRGKVCAYCGLPAQGNFTIHRDGFGAGPEVPLCDACGGGASPSSGEIWARNGQGKDQCAARVREKRQLRVDILAVLRAAARQRCDKGNCGTVCLCVPCHARRALESYDPTWRP
jgi:hypothetical protein